MPSTTKSIIAALFTVLVLGLFIGTNLGVLLICLMRMASPDPEPEAELARMALKDRTP